MNPRRGQPPPRESSPGPSRLAAFVLLFLLLIPSPGAGAAEELRGLWVDAFHPGFRSQPEIDQLLAEARATGFNALFVEVRRRGDTFYQSTFEPFCAEVEPGFDPLHQLLLAAHDTNRGPRLEIHAWVVAFNIWNNLLLQPSQPDHPFLRHADWLTRNRAGATWDGYNFAFDPGHPEVQDYTFQVIMDLVRRYDLDGLHLDYIRYSGREFGYHEAALRRFNERFGRSGIPDPADPDWSQFRRDQVTALVRKVYLTALEEKPALKISAATITFAPGIVQTAQWPSSSAFSDVLQDWRAWMEEGILDWNLPMAYFRQPEHADALADWAAFIKDHQYHRRAALGLGWFFNTVPNSLAQTRLARRPSPAGNQAMGFVGYAYANAATNAPRNALFSALTRPTKGDRRTPPILATPASVPSMPWKTTARTSHLKGIVRDAQTEAPLEPATVTLDGPVQRTLTTDATGFFGAVDLPPGDYVVRVITRDHDALTADVSLKGGTVAHREYLLESRSKPTADPP